MGSIGPTVNNCQDCQQDGVEDIPKIFSSLDRAASRLEDDVIKSILRVDEWNEG